LYAARAMLIKPHSSGEQNRVKHGCQSFRFLSINAALLKSGDFPALEFKQLRTNNYFENLLLRFSHATALRVKWNFSFPAGSSIQFDPKVICEPQLDLLYEM
jgi:hypothetical protein